MYISRFIKYFILFLGTLLLIHFITLFISIFFTRNNSDIAIVYPFATDGCTLFIDGDYSDCCQAHDRSYWQGGPLYKKLLADANLYACIAERGHNVRENIMFVGVLFGGNPGIPTQFRWGFGFPYPYYNIDKN